MKIEFSVWGRMPEHVRESMGFKENIRLAAMQRPGESRLEAVARSIERRTGLVWCGGPRSDGSAVERGRVTAHHYAGTLGSPCDGGGWTPRAELWFSIPAKKGKTLENGTT